ncbi:MAG: response regulator transcription factor [Solirubrobacterales bacterium]
MRSAVIVDDEDLSIDLIKYLIKRYQFPIEVIGQASAGDEAVEIISRTKPDLVFIDIRMPILNGLEVIEKTNTSYRDISFIVITAFGYFEYAQAALRLGAKDILLKPIEPDLFFQTVERVLGHRQTDNRIFNEILEYVNSNYQNNIELKDCALKFHTSSSYISRMFRKYCSTSFISYLNDIRIKSAVKLLEETDMSIKEVAFKVGYNNLNYFYKIFKKNTGATPSVFKNKEN